MPEIVDEEERGGYCNSSQSDVLHVALSTRFSFLSLPSLFVSSTQASATDGDRTTEAKNARANLVNGRRRTETSRRATLPVQWSPSDACPVGFTRDPFVLCTYGISLRSTKIRALPPSLIEARGSAYPLAPLCCTVRYSPATTTRKQ